MTTSTTHAPAPTAEPAQPEFVFSQAVEGLFKALGPIDDATAARFVGIGFNPKGPFLPAYPVDQYVELMWLAVNVHDPDAPFDEGVTSLGRRFVDGYGDTLVGKAMLTGLRMLGPRRTLEKLTRQLSTGSSFFQSALTPLMDNEWALTLNRVTWPGWYIGLLERGLEIAGAHDVHVTLLSHQGSGREACFSVKWT